MARPSGWCPKCKKYVKDIYKKLDGDFLNIEFRTWNGEKYEEIKNMVAIPPINVYTLCAKCNSPVLFENKTTYFLHQD